MKSWKQAEKRVAALTGGTRRPNTGHGGEDVEHAKLSLEVKHGASIPKFITDAMSQAKRQCPDGKVPVACFHKKGARATYAVITAQDLADIAPETVLCMDIGELAKLVNGD